MFFVKTKTVKTYIKQLVKRMGSKDAVARKLGITLRYIYMLEKGKIPGEHLRKIIKLVLEKKL